LAWTLLQAQNAPKPEDPKPADSEKIEPLQQSITVTGTIIGETPASITTLQRSQVLAQPGVDLDDRLRAVPGFSLFRRSSSIAANPTTQGISLRGLGSSGASRTLLLWDGIPVNSPFGGWIYWTRLDPEDVERIEISRGASTSVFGDKAMGGAIQVFTRPPEPWRLTLAAEGGGEETAGLTGAFSHVWKRVGLTARVRAFSTDGYFIVPASIRGPVDTHAGVEFVAGSMRLDFFGAIDKFFVRLDTLAEQRMNGTTLTQNSTGLGTLAASWSRELPQDGFSVIAYHTRENFHASFSAVGAGRRTETLSFLQHAPSEAVGFDGLWRHNASAFTTLVGADFQRVEGISTDFLVPTGTRIGQGERIERGFFGQGTVKLGSARLYLGARQDFAGAGNSFFSPSGGVTAGKGLVRLRASAYRSFRAPTLNELYRTFRAGNAVTNANPNLQLEKLFGAEAGFDLVGETRRLSVTGFRNSLDNVITNVTLSVTPTLTTRQRQNAASAVTHGLEARFEQRWRNWRAEASYLLADSRYSTHLRVPQVARTQGSAQLMWERGRTFLSGGLRAYSLQFEDDINSLILPGYSTIQFVARQRLTKSLTASGSIENLLDHQYLTGRTPAPQIGGPRLWRLGLRWDGPVR
jgi:outer membrane cobalamin receptor